ncbi:hypothetical protein [Nocardioides zeae]|uniref:Uncharacterized protein n=1 Tax=Nocardioides zeae TaxID=1457234 RepID=A0A6P0HNA4_9ACTN|nr:hypothetical protein [Nocardioides zeae]NEN79770.1 hypothetical protein [Nocardioides zeae]
MALELGETAALVDDQAAARLSRAMQVATRALAERLDLVIGEPDDAPPALDRFLDLDHRQVRQVALRAARVPGDAVEVVVLLRLPLGGSEPHP